MQDRFKFRVWDKRHKEYTYDVQNGFQKYGHMICETLDFGQTLNDDELEIEQCTGLTDKNNKLIYEGDIVKILVLYNGIPTGKKQRCKVYYKHGAFNIYAIKSEYLKVIGNIHENSELLEE